MTTWTHPDAILRMRIRGLEPNCQHCRHLFTGPDRDDHTWCGPNKIDPCPRVRDFSDPRQVCPHFQDKEPERAVETP